jgi:hypothetical protein
MIFNLLKKKIKQFIKPKVKSDCKQKVPVIKYLDTSWLHLPTTPDQQRIENYLKTLSISGKKILHVGTGNSSFAKQFHLNNIIDSITIVNDEIEYAMSLNLPNYNCYKINKYSNEILNLSTKYDIISDNNLSSFACCRKHFEEMMRNYFSMLNKGGFIITDKMGMAYFQESAFQITVEDIKKVLPNANVKVIDKTVLIIKPN